MTVVVIAIVVLLTLNAWRITWQRSRSGFSAQFTAQSPIGLGRDEHAIGFWNAERYFGPLVPGSERQPGDWAWVLARNLLPGRHWLATQPFIRHRGAPMQVRLTNQGRLLVTIAKGYESLRPKVVADGSEAKHGFEMQLAAGPPDKARIETLEEAFPGAQPGALTEPDRDRWWGRSAVELIRITAPVGDPIVLWIERDAVGALREWAADRYGGLGSDERLASTQPLAGEPRVRIEYAHREGPHDDEELWVPRLVDNRTGEVIVSFWGTWFSGIVELERRGVVRMMLRDISMSVVQVLVDIDERTIHVRSEDVPIEHVRPLFQRILWASPYRVMRPPP